MATFSLANVLSGRGGSFEIPRYCSRGCQIVARTESLGHPLDRIQDPFGGGLYLRVGCGHRWYALNISRDNLREMERFYDADKYLLYFVIGELDLHLSASPRQEPAGTARELADARARLVALERQIAELRERPSLPLAATPPAVATTLPAPEASYAYDVKKRFENLEIRGKPDEGE